MDSFLDVEYGEHPAQRLDLYTPTPEDAYNDVLIVFVHGGAWRAEDKKDHAQLAHRILQRTHCTVAVPNYRLSPRESTDGAPVRHPTHAADMLAALEFLVGNCTIEAMHTSFSRLFLIGHSCSAHMLSSVFLQSPFHELKPSPELLRAVQAIALSEGIYDLDLLCQSFPTYRAWFVEAAFGPPSFTNVGEGYECFSAAKYLAREDFTHAHWLLVHSLGDTLIDQKQTDMMYSHLKSLLPEDQVKRDVSSITMEHNDMLKTDAYSDFMSDYVRTMF